MITYRIRRHGHELDDHAAQTHAQFSGRAHPREYWMYALSLFLCMIGITMVERMRGLGDTRE